MQDYNSRICGPSRNPGITADVHDPNSGPAYLAQDTNAYFAQKHSVWPHILCRFHILHKLRHNVRNRELSARCWFSNFSRAPRTTHSCIRAHRAVFSFFLSIHFLALSSAQIRWSTSKNTPFTCVVGISKTHQCDHWLKSSIRRTTFKYSAQLKYNDCVTTKGVWASPVQNRFQRRKNETLMLPTCVYDMC